MGVILAFEMCCLLKKKGTVKPESSVNRNYSPFFSEISDFLGVKLEF